MIWIKRFIERIQNSDEQTKRKWLVLFSITAMMIIAAVWIIFVVSDFSISSMSLDVPVDVKDEPGFLQILKNGISIIFDSASENFKDIFSRITEKKTIVIE